MSSLLPSILLAGCGDIACRLARQLSGQFSFTGLRRNPDQIPAPINPIAADLCDAREVSRALAGQLFDYVVVTLTPGERTEARYHAVYIEGMRNLLAALHGRPRILFVSSTSVYAQDSGEWVDEQSPATGSGFSGRCLLEAETLAQSSGFPVSCVRFSGIYGPGRERLLRMVQEGRVNPAEAAQWTNRIHADDGASVLAFLIRRWEQGIEPARCYVASDTCPTQAGDVWQWLAAEVCAEDRLAGLAWRQRAPAGKRCDSRRLQGEGFHFRYADFRAGYGTMLSGK